MIATWSMYRISPPVSVSTACLLLKIKIVRVSQGRLHHINDGANAPWKKKGGKVSAAFFREFLGKIT